MSDPSDKPATTLLLAIETSSRVGSVALSRGDNPPTMHTLTGDRRHASELMPSIQRLLRDASARLADVDVLAWSCGPGSFTGLRIGATIARMAHSVAGCRVVSVPTFDALAAAAFEHSDAPDRLVTLLGANRGRVIAAAYERDGDRPRVLHPTALYDPNELFTKLEPPFWILGEGIARHRDACEATPGTIAPETTWRPDAGHVAVLGRRMADASEYCPPERIIPLYVRPPECEEVYEQRRAEARARRGE